MREFGRPKIKALPLSEWMMGDGCAGFRQRLFNDCVEDSIHYKQVKPRFNRPGRYLENGVSWFETKAGNAYIENSNGDFLYQLTLKNLSELRKEDIAGIKAIAKSHLATKKQKKMASDLEDFEEIERSRIQLSISARATLKRVRARIAELKAKKEATT